MQAALRLDETRPSGIRGVLGRPFVDLAPYLDLAPLDAVHEEICFGLTQVPTGYTGGSHRSMEIVPPGRASDVGVDYGEVIARLDDPGYATLRSLADDPESFPDRCDGASFGEEREHPLSRRQMLWLKMRHGVYFPWKVFVEMIPNRAWGDKARAEGKDFTRVARTFFPKTVAYVKSLPFVAIGRCNILGLEGGDHGTVHRDRDDDGPPDPFITLCPAGDKRLFLWDDRARTKVPVTGRAYWFNDGDYHGVDADPFFRYSVRIDGAFRPDFLETLGGATRP